MAIDVDTFGQSVIDATIHQNWPGSSIAWNGGTPTVTFPDDTPSDDEINQACVAYLAAGLNAQQSIRDSMDAVGTLAGESSLGQLVRAAILSAGSRANDIATALLAIVDAITDAADFAAAQTALAALTPVSIMTDDETLTAVEDQVFDNVPPPPVDPADNGQTVVINNPVRNARIAADAIVQISGIVNDPGSRGLRNLTVSIRGPVGTETQQLNVVFQRWFLNQPRRVVHPWRATWSTLNLPSGTYEITVEATQAALNQFDTNGISVSVVIVAGPWARFTLPAPQRTPTGGLAAPQVTGTITLQVSAGAPAPSDITSVLFEYRSASTTDWTTIDTATSAPFQADLDTTALANGGYLLRATATSIRGEVVETSYSVIAANTPPAITITAPAYGASVSGSSVTFSAASADADSVLFERRPANSNTWTAIATDSSSPFLTTVNVTGLTGGRYVWRATATNSIGSVSAYVDVLVNNGPAVCWIAIRKDYRSDRKVYVLAEARDLSGTGIATVVFAYSLAGANDWHTIGTGSTSGSDETLYWYMTGSPPVSAWDVSALANGTYDVRAVATDNNSGSTTATITFVKDTVPSCVLIYPGTNVSGTVALSALASDWSGSGIASVLFEYSDDGGSTWTTIGTDSSAPYSASWDTSGLTSGSYRIRATATDNASGTASATQAVTVNVGPACTLTSPSNGNILGNPVSRAAATATDYSGQGIRDVSFYYSADAGTTWTFIRADTRVPYEIIWTTTGLASGSYLLKAVATDNAGFSTSSQITVTVNSGPSVSISAPADAASVSGASVTFSASATDYSGAGLTNVKFEYLAPGDLDWTTIATDSSAAYSTSWNTTSLSNGNYGLRATVTDNNGGTNSATITVSVGNAPDVSITAPSDSDTVNGASVTFSATATDHSGAGITNVVFAYRTAGSGSYTTIATDSASPFTTTWDTTGLTNGDFDLKATVTDNAGGTNNEVITVTVSNTSAQAIVLNGTSQCVNFDSKSSIRFTGAISWSVWFYLPSLPGADAAIISRWDNDVDGQYRILIGTAGQVAIVGKNTISQIWVPQTATGVVTAATLHHFVMTISSSGAVTLYIDNSTVSMSGGAGGGSSIGSGGIIDGSLHVYDLILGGALASGVANSQLFPGNLDAFRLYDKELDSTEVAELYGSGAGLATAGSASANLKLWAKLDGDVTDSSGNSNDGTAVGSPTYTSSSILG